MLIFPSASVLETFLLHLLLCCLFLWLFSAKLPTSNLNTTEQKAHNCLLSWWTAPQHGARGRHCAETQAQTLNSHSDAQSNTFGCIQADFILSGGIEFLSRVVVSIKSSPSTTLFQQPNIDFGIWLLSNFHKTSNYYPNNYFKDVTRPSGAPRSWKLIMQRDNCCEDFFFKRGCRVGGGGGGVLWNWFDKPVTC